MRWSVVVVVVVAGVAPPTVLQPLRIEWQYGCGIRESLPPYCLHFPLLFLPAVSYYNFHSLFSNRPLCHSWLVKYCTHPTPVNDAVIITLYNFTSLSNWNPFCYQCWIVSLNMVVCYTLKIWYKKMYVNYTNIQSETEKLSSRLSGANLKHKFKRWIMKLSIVTECQKCNC